MADVPSATKSYRRCDWYDEPRHYDHLPEGDPTTLPSPPAGGDDAPVRWLYYTSGTTSDPKGVQHTDQTLIAAGTGLAKALEATSDDVGTIAFPYAHIGGPVVP